MTLKKRKLRDGRRVWQKTGEDGSATARITLRRIIPGPTIFVPSIEADFKMKNMMKTQTPNKWFGQRHNNKPFQPEPRIVQREVTMVRILKKAPYKTTYAEFTYAIQPVEDQEGKVSYIAARMLASNGRLHQPLHEYELSRRFPSLTGAENAWATGFEAREDYFLARTLIGLLIEEEAAEKLPAPDSK